MAGFILLCTSSRARILSWSRAGRWWTFSPALKVSPAPPLDDDDDDDNDDDIKTIPGPRGDARPPRPNVPRRLAAGPGSSDEPAARMRAPRAQTAS